jgi:uncharacterized protein
MPASKLARRWLPSPENLAKIKGLAWLSNYLEPRPWLWVAHRRKVAMGVAVGLAVGVIPLPVQMLLGALCAVLFRCNVAAAVAATWLTNPFTLVPIWGLALWLGSLVVSTGGVSAAPEMLALDWTAPATWWPALTTWIQGVGPAWLLGMPMAALLLGVAAYVVVFYAWTAVIKLERARRLRARRARLR